MTCLATAFCNSTGHHWYCGRLKGVCRRVVQCTASLASLGSPGGLSLTAWAGVVPSPKD